jgi:hypothetical protein
MPSHLNPIRTSIRPEVQESAQVSRIIDSPIVSTTLNDGRKLHYPQFYFQIGQETNGTPIENGRLCSTK